MEAIKSWLSTLISLILLANLGIAQISFTRQELLDDMDSLYVMIHDVHPDMFAFTSKEVFENELNMAKLLIEDNMTIMDFYIIIAPLIAKLKDGHTSVYYPYSFLKDDSKMFPLKLSIRYPCMSAHVINNLSESSNIPEGALIESINGYDMNKLVGMMLSCISGERDSYRVAMMNQRFNELIYAVLPDSIFSIEYAFDNQIRNIEFPAMTYSEFAQALKIIEEKQKKIEDYTLSVDLENRIAVIYFNYLNDLSCFEMFIDSVFTEIKNEGISDLIIDIRNNNGGHSNVGDEFFQYISSLPFEQFGKVQVKFSNRQIAFQEKHFGIDFSDYHLGITTVEVDRLKGLRDNNLRFSGNICLLTGPYTFSAASSFAWTFQYFNMGTIIGEETGGLVVCFGDIIPQLLPNTQMQFGTSYKKFYNYGATDENTHGVIPDYEVSQQEAMDFAIDLILKGRK